VKAKKSQKSSRGPTKRGRSKSFNKKKSIGQAFDDESPIITTKKKQIKKQVNPQIQSN